MTQTIVTNLRMDKPDWLQIKAMAGEMGMSMNKYINYLIRKVTTKEMLGVKKDVQRASIWDLPKLAKMKNAPGELSEEDEIIYA